jgi:hypothetical protein
MGGVGTAVWATATQDTWRLLESTREINAVGKKSTDRPGKPGDSGELASFRQIVLLHIYITYYMRVNVHTDRPLTPH